MCVTAYSSRFLLRTDLSIYNPVGTWSQYSFNSSTSEITCKISTMKAIVCVCLFVAVALARPSDDDAYPTKYDNINVDEILENDRLFESYVECILEKGKAKCNAEAKELKSHIKEALENHCGKCNDKQKEIVRKVIKYLINSKEGVWAELVTKYDPEHKYSKKYEDELKELKA